ncbi:hypothetical protein LY76DRAFT_651644 [Colletotrichum caudatum]|nr:hypothetical protein LY76DRAFT_651644 [Colletotrichum caudatum]
MPETNGVTNDVPSKWKIDDYIYLPAKESWKPSNKFTPIRGSPIVTGARNYYNVLFNKELKSALVAGDSFQI